jgi:hypothetical protein
MKETVKYQSNIIPEVLAVRKLGKDLYEIVSNENIETVNKIDENGLNQTVFASDMSIVRQEIKNRSEMIAALIRIKYTSDDEYALINKGISDKDNAEYVAYRQYVSLCKEQSLVYF